MFRLMWVTHSDFFFIMDKSTLNKSKNLDDRVAKSTKNSLHYLKHHLKLTAVQSTAYFLNKFSARKNVPAPKTRSEDLSFLSLNYTTAQPTTYCSLYCFFVKIKVQSDLLRVPKTYFLILLHTYK